MDDLNAYHDFWESALPRSRRNRSGLSLSTFLANSATFSLLTPPGLPTRTDSVSGNPSTLDLCLGNGPLLTTITTGPYMGSDYLPIVIFFPSVPTFHPPLSSRRPRWSFKKGDWGSFQKEINLITPSTILPSQNRKIKFNTLQTPW